MKMSDKDFDQLFNTKLADMEMEPSANVWSNITNELDGKKEKAAGIPFMRIAATIVVIMCAGLFFLRPAQPVMNLHGSGDSTGPAASAQTNTPALQSQSVSTDPATEDTANQVKTLVKHHTTVLASSAAIAKINNMVKSKADSVTSKRQNVSAAPSEAVVNTNTQVITATQQQVMQTPEVKGGTLPAKANNIEPVRNTVPIIAANPTTKTADAVKKKRGIHSLGDLLNVVIAKVDKRQDKLIEFTNNSDDDSFNVTGVNLGLIHAKREN